MKKIVTAAALASGLVLASCAGGTPETPEQIVFSASSTYIALEATAGLYESLPRCDQTEEKVCSERDIVEVIRKVAETTYTSLKAAQEIVRDDSGVYNALTKQSTAENLNNVLDNFKSVLNEFGVLEVTQGAN